MVEQPGRVNDLPAQILVVRVSDKERLGGEGVWLDLDVGARDRVDERRLADIGEARDDERACVGVDGREAGQMLTHLFEICQCAGLTTHDGAHTTQCRPLQLLAPVQRVSKLHQPHKVLRHTVNMGELNMGESWQCGSVLVDEMARRVDLAQCELVVVLVVQHIDEVSIEGVDVIQCGELRTMQLRRTPPRGTQGRASVRMAESLSWYVCCVKRILRR